LVYKFFWLFDFFRLAQVLGSHRGTSATVADVGDFPDLRFAQMPMVWNKRSAPVAPLVQAVQGYTEMPVFPGRFHAGGTDGFIIFGHGSSSILLRCGNIPLDEFRFNHHFLLNLHPGKVVGFHLKHVLNLTYIMYKILTGFT
jgi:hypothetical protein